LIAEIVTIGTELLLGEITDTNAAHIARQLASIGVDHLYTTTVGDNEERIVGVLQQALARADAVITTGGLGPTVDDVTRQAVAHAAHRDMEFRADLLAKIDAYFGKRGMKMTENNRRQAYFPTGAIVVENPVGTAPAFIVEIGERSIISLPGVPHEMEYLLRERVLPYLSHKMGHGAVILCRMVHTVGMGESVIDQAITDLMHNVNPTVGTRAHPAQTDVCITAKAATREEALQLLAPVEVLVRQRLGNAVFGADAETLPGVVVAELLRRGLTLAVGETHTGGLLARRLLEAEGGARVLRGSHIALDLAALAREVHIPPAKNEEDTARAISEALRSSPGADLGLAVAQGSEETSRLHIVLATPNGAQALVCAPTAQARQSPSRGRSDYAIAWTYHTALDVVRQWLTACDPNSSH
jgi:nicotinamide-nucleotide amidase